MSFSLWLACILPARINFRRLWPLTLMADSVLLSPNCLAISSQSLPCSSISVRTFSYSSFVHLSRMCTTLGTFSTYLWSLFSEICRVWFDLLWFSSGIGIWPSRFLWFSDARSAFEISLRTKSKNFSDSTSMKALSSLYSVSCVNYLYWKSILAFIKKIRSSSSCLHLSLSASVRSVEISSGAVSSSTGVSGS